MQKSMRSDLVLIRSSSKTRHANKIQPEDLKAIMLELATIIRDPCSYTREALALNSQGEPEDVFSTKAVQCDMYGWISKLSYGRWHKMRTGRKTRGDMVSMYIDSHIRTVSGGKLRLMLLGDTDPLYASKYLYAAAQKINSGSLPKLFKYAVDYGTEEEQLERFNKQKERVAKFKDKEKNIKE